MSDKVIKGIMPALVTPLKSDRKTLDKESLRTLVAFHKSQGADGFYVAGATGEGLVLSMETKKALIDESICEIGEDKLKIIHIADMNFENTIELAKYAEKAGADAISAIPPIYFGYDSEDIYNYYKNIAKSVDIPLMLYYTPSANITIDTNLFERLSKIDNITSIKWTVKDYYRLIELLSRTDGKINIINGPDEMLLCGLSAGCSGGIGTTYNVMLPLYKKIYSLYLEGKMQEALCVQKKADKYISILLKYSLIPAVKAVLEEMGHNVGPASEPMKLYTKEEKKIIINDLKSAGFEF